MTDRNGTLNVTGTGRVQVAPDEAIITLGVVSEARTAAEATASNARLTQAVIDAVSLQPNHGVTTSGLSVFPIMSYDPNTGVGTIVGFRATNWVEVRTKIEYAGLIFDTGITAGATQSSGISFRIRNEAPYREEALRLAVAEAFREAQLVAGAACVELQGVERIQIDPAQARFFYRAEALDARAVVTPVIPEAQTVSATVQIQFRIRDLT